MGMMRKAFRHLLIAFIIVQVFCSFNGYADGSWYHDYRFWSQNQTGYTDTSYHAMKNYGCCVVAQAKMLYDMGVERDPSFNPDRYLDWEIANGYVANYSHIEQLSFAGPVAYAAQKGKEVTYFGDNWDKSTGQIWYNINAGYWTIVDLGSHYILIDNETSKATGQLYFWESACDWTYTEPRPLSIHSSWNKIHVYKYTPVATAPLNVNGRLDGIASENLGSFGTFDITVGGSTATGVNEYNNALAVGTSYQISNIQAAHYYQYNGVSSGSLSGTVGASGTTVVLDFAKVTPTGFSLGEGFSIQEGRSSVIGTTFMPSDTHNDHKGLTWTSSDTDVATVTSDGVVIAVAEGTTVITATSIYNPSLQDTCTITVTKGIPKPTITSVDVDGYDVRVTWSESPLVNDEDVRTYKVTLSRNSIFPVFTKSGITDTYLDFTVSGPGTYRVVVSAVNATTGASSSSASKNFTVDMVITGEWQTASTLPSNVTPENCEIQYKHTYYQEAVEAPGADWERGDVVSTEYRNVGGVYDSDFELAVSDTRVYMGSYYYHYCGAGMGSTVEHYQTSQFTDYHPIGDVNQYIVEAEYVDDHDSRYHSYMLRWASGQWAGGYATCSGGRSALYYRRYQYQDREAVTTYGWTKQDADWVTTKDDSASSVIYRFRLKDQEKPVIESIAVTGVSTDGYTISCKFSDNIGISSISFVTWSDVGGEESALAVDTLFDTPVTVWEGDHTVSITHYGSVRDCTYHTAVYVKDAAGNTASCSGDDTAAYIPMLFSSANRLILPAELKMIAEGAFEGDMSFGEVVLQDGVETIGSRAFADCGRLVKIHVPDSVMQIAADAFANSSNVVLVCESNNTAAQLARRNGWHYVTQ